MIKIIVVLLVTLYLNGSAQTVSTDSMKSQSEYRKRAENIKGVNHYSYSDKPIFPPENQIKDIKGKREVHSRTKTKLYFGLANTSRSSTDMNESFANMESSYGIHNVNNVRLQTYLDRMYLKLRDTFLISKSFLICNISISDN